MDAVKTWRPDAPRLQGTLRCDTVIVGAGIAGLSVAYELAQAGQKVIVVDRGSIAGGMTSRTTGASRAGLRRRRQLAHHDCAARKPPGFSSRARRRRSTGSKRSSRSTTSPAISAGLTRSCSRRSAWSRARRASSRTRNTRRCEKPAPTSRSVKGVPLKGFEDAPVLRYARQATFHPLKYLRGVVAAIEEKGGRLFANSAVTEIEELEDGVRVTTDGGSGHRGTRRVRDQFADQRPRRAAQQDGALSHLCDGLHAAARHACPMRSTGTWPIPTITSASIRAPAPPTI